MKIILQIFQVHADIVATKAKDILVIYTQAGKSILLRIWDSTPFLLAKDVWREGATKLITLVQATRIKILDIIDLKGIYYNLLDLISKKCKCKKFLKKTSVIHFVLGTKRDVYFGCSGLLVGVFLGVAIGLSIKRREQFVRYMQAVQSCNYLGLEVEIYKYSLIAYDIK